MPIVVTTTVGPNTAGSVGTTLTAARQFVAREAGPFLSSTADASSNVNAVIDLTWPVRSTNDQSGLYQDHHLYRPAAVATADKTRIVRSYSPSTGSVVPDLTYANTPAGEVFELLGTLAPAFIERCINDALKELMVEIEFTIAPVLNNTRHALPALVATWLLDSSWVRQVGYLGVNELRDQVDPYDNRIVRGEAYKDAGVLYLKHPGRTFDPTQTTLYVKAISPAYFQCRATNLVAFGSKNDGLTAEANEAPLDLEWLAAAALVECWRRNAQVLEQSANALLAKDLLTAIQWKTDQTETHMLIPPLTFLPAVRSWGPRW